MVARNDITGDTIQTKSTSNAYRDNYDNIWKKEKSMQIRVKEDAKEFGKCGCGRSPTGYCVGFHGLSEQEWAEGKTQLIHNLVSGHGNVIENMSDEEWDNLGKDIK